MLSLMCRLANCSLKNGTACGNTPDFFNAKEFDDETGLYYTVRGIMTRDRVFGFQRINFKKIILNTLLIHILITTLLNNL